MKCKQQFSRSMFSEPNSSARWAENIRFFFKEVKNNKVIYRLLHLVKIPSEV